MTMVQYGMRGKAVVELQQALVDQGYEIDVDGDFGPATDAALRDFQANNELDVDGIAGPETWAMLAAEDEEAEEEDEEAEEEAEEEDEEAEEEDEEAEEEDEEDESPPTLALGAVGSAVRALQEALVELEWEIDVDGDFGPATEEAVREFQEQNDLDIDGIVGPLTWEALGF